MNKSIIIFLTVAAVVLGGYLLFTNLEPQENSPVTTEPTVKAPIIGDVPFSDSNIISYTGVTYLPSTLRVRTGTNVTFKNDSSLAMWAASAMHPTHGVYPTTGGCLGSTFDACKGVQPGDSWSFDFDIAGTWKYHDHLNPSARGTVIVEE